MSFALSAQLARYEPLRSLGFGSIPTGSWATVGTPYINPARIIKITNTTNANILISYDGVNSHDIVTAGTAEIIDYCSDKTEQAGVLEQQANTQVYVQYSGGAPTTGSVYVTLIYGSTGSTY